MTKTRNWHTRAIYLIIALVMTLGLLIVPTVSVAQGETEVGACLGLVDGNDTAAWSTTQTRTETVNVMGAYSAFLDKATGAAGSTHVQFAPPSGITLANFQAAITAGTPEWSFYHWLENIGVTNGPQFELRFEDQDPASQGWVEITAVGLQGTTGTAAWLKETLSGTTPAGYGGWGEAGIGAPFFNWGPLTPLSGIEAAIDAEANVGDASDWVLTRVRVELWEAINQSCYIDDITLAGTTYDLEPGYELVPAIAKNVKTADETFTLMNGCGEEVDPKLVSGWLVTKGEGVGAVTIVDGGADGENYITVRMVTAGDCIITCNVAGLVHPVNAEKKWGEIDSTELTAWDDDPCDEERPVGAETEHNRVIDLGTPAASQSVLVQEKVIANFLPGPVPAPAGGAKITWWLLENDAAGLAQAALEDLLEKFDSYDYVSGELGYGEGCGQYGDWAGDPTFIPETLLNAIYATYAASDTNFVKAECSTILATTKTVTYTDHVWETLGEGLTNVTVQFDEVGATGYAEPAIVVVLADYPLDKNGENAVCVEYFKFKPTIVIIPETCQVKVPQVKWAGEKIVLEKDWGTEYAGHLVGFYLEEGCIGNMIPFPLATETHVLVSGDARTALTAVDAYGVARCMFESEQQGQVDVKCVLYNADFVVSASYKTMQGFGRTSEVLGNHGFLVYYLALEDVTVDEEYSDLESNAAAADADVLVKVRGWFTSDALPGTSRLPVDANGDYVYELPAGRYVLPDDWAALAGSDEATSNLASRPQYDLMNTPGAGVESDYQLGPFDSGVRTTTPPGEADDLVIGPFSTLQPWNCVDALGNPTNMWIADNVVPADYTIASLYTIPRTAADVRNTVVPDATIDEFDCPMPPALVTFDVDDTEVLNELDKGDASGYGVDASGDYIAPFYAMEIPSHVLIPIGGYHWDSWGGWTAPTTDDGPYNFWDDLGVTPNDADILEVYSDNHGYAGVTIDGYGLENECVTLDVIADFPVMTAKYPAVETEEEVCWGAATRHLNPDFEADPRSGTAPLVVTFDPSWTTGGLTPYVKAEWDFNNDGTFEVTRTGSWATPSAIPVETWTYNFPGTYTIALRITDSTTPIPLVHTETKTGYVIVTGTSNPYDANYNGIIDKSEAVQAVTDYFDGLISKSEVLGVIALYFESAG